MSKPSQGVATLRVEHLSKSYRSRGSREEVHALRDVSFTLYAGQAVALLGPNGAGKTTTIKCVCQLITPSSGHVIVHGIDARAQPRRALQHLAATFDASRNVDMRLTVRENLEWFAGLQGIRHSEARATIEPLLEAFRLAAYRDGVAQTLSRGTVQRLAIACCLVKRANVILLDEPTLGLDLESAYELRGMIKLLTERAGNTVLISSHDMAMVEDVCERALVMRRAEIVSDSSLASLVTRFSRHEYEVTIAGDPSEQARRRLLGHGFDLKVDPDTGRLFVRVAHQEDDLYGVLDAVRTSGARLESVAPYRPAIEDVLNRLLHEEA